jgi:hypothetical protein
MPLHYGSTDESEVLFQDYSDVYPHLFRDEETLTPLGESVALFLEDVNFDSLLENEDLAPLAESRLDESETDEDGEPVEIIEMDGEVVAAAIDEDDLGGMFDNFVENELAEDDSFSGRLRYRAVMDALGIDEARRAPFKKGSFRGLARSGPDGRDRVNRMLGAMIAKGVIRKTAKAGSGYKGGDYQRSGGYPVGKGKDTDRTRKASSLVTGKTGKISQKDAKNAGFGHRDTRWARFKLSRASKGASNLAKSKVSTKTIGGVKLKSTVQKLAAANKNKAKKVAAAISRKGGKFVAKGTGSKRAVSQAKAGGFNSVAQMRAKGTVGDSVEHAYASNLLGETDTPDSLEESESNVLSRMGNSVLGARSITETAVRRLGTETLHG